MSLSAQLLAILVCPKCKGPLEYREQDAALLCHQCRLRYPVRDDIPIMLLDEATPLCSLADAASPSDRVSPARPGTSAAIDRGARRTRPFIPVR